MSDIKQVRAKKRFGQHFLHDPNAIGRIAGHADPTPECNLLEIGPGTGNLTNALLTTYPEHTVHAVERDTSLLPILEERFGTERLRVIDGDATAVPFEALPEGPTVVVGNLPYNVGTAIFLRFLEKPTRFYRTVFMFQLEVAKRITASAGTSEYGSLSVAAQLWGEHKIVLRLPPGAFTPPPKVDSAVVVSNFSSAPLLEVRGDPAGFQRMVRATFKHRRKTLSKSLSLSGWSRTKVDTALERLDLPLQIRGERLSPTQFAALWVALGED